MSSRAVAHSPASAASARRWLADELRVAGLPGDLIADAELVLTELISNAVQYAFPLSGDRIEIGYARGDTLALWVVDGGSGTGAPQRTDADMFAAHGRGLTIVSSLADDWGVHQRAGSVRVWARMRLSTRVDSAERPAARYATR